MFFKFEICRTSATSPYVEDMFSHDERYDADVYGTASAWPETIGPATSTMPAVFREDVARALMDSGLTGMKFVPFGIGYVRSKKLRELPMPRYFALLPQGKHDYQSMIYQTQEEEPGLERWQKPRNALWTPADGTLVEKGKAWEAEKACTSRYKTSRRIPVEDSWDGSDFSGPVSGGNAATFYCSERAAGVLRKLKIRGVFLTPCDALSLSGEGFAAAKLPWPPGPACYRSRFEGGPPLGLTPQPTGSPVASVLIEDDKTDPSKLLWFGIETEAQLFGLPVRMFYNRRPESDSSHEPCSTEEMTVEWLKSLLPAALQEAEGVLGERLSDAECAKVASAYILLEHAEIALDEWSLVVDSPEMGRGWILLFDDASFHQIEEFTFEASGQGTADSAVTATCTFSFAHLTLPD